MSEEKTKIHKDGRVISMSGNILEFMLHLGWKKTDESTNPLPASLLLGDKKVVK